MSQMILLAKVRTLLGSKSIWDYKQIAPQFEMVVMERSKRNNIKIIYNGDRYDSISEGIYAWILNDMLTSNRIKSVERQKKYPLQGLERKTNLWYVSDFEVTGLSGEIYTIDLKGYLSRDDIYKISYVQYVYNSKVHLVRTTGPNKFTTGFIL